MPNILLNPNANTNSLLDALQPGAWTSKTDPETGLKTHISNQSSNEKSLFQKVADVLNNAVSPIANKNAAAAAKANEVSHNAQLDQMAFNSAQMSAANAYNTAYLQAQQNYNQQAAAQANAINQAMWQQTADFNSAEAAKNREWQEYMSNTSYQRAVKDLRAAGLNPILAAMNGGASMGTGASGTTAAISAAQANSGLQNADMASAGLYQGVMENTSNMLAIISALAAGAQAFNSGKSIENNVFYKAGESMGEFLKKLFSKH